MLVDNLYEHLSAVEKAESIQEHRDLFTAFSNDLIEMVEVIGLGGNKVYVQYCPMANDDTGGYWLSEEEDILNPYFGDEMLRCGEVERSLD